jgi:hypothetical protein
LDRITFEYAMGERILARFRAIEAARKRVAIVDNDPRR